MDNYVVKRAEIEAMQGTDKTHFLNSNAKRVNKSLGDLTGLTGLGFHIIEVEPGHESTEFHVHHYEDECTYVLSGNGTVRIGEQHILIEAGDFIGYRKGGHAHTMINTGEQTLVCIVVGQRLAHDVGDYPDLKKRLFRNTGQPWNLVDVQHVVKPVAGKK